MKELESDSPMTGAKKNRTAILSVSERGARLGQRIKSLVAPHADCYEKENRPSGGEAIYFDSLKHHIGQIFKDYDQVLCIMALGIVVRMIAPYIEHKSKDPAIVVMDEAGHHVISLLSGHLGGANEWTQSISLAIDADPVITTATDVNGLPAPDVVARHEHLLVDDFQTLVDVNSAVVAGETVNYYIDNTLVNAQHLVQSATAHIGTHGTVQMVDVFTLPDIKSKAPEGMEELPELDAVIIGGSAGGMTGIMDEVQRLLKVGGRLVVTAVTMETGYTILKELKGRPFTYEGYQMSISRYRKAGPYHLLDPLSPIFIVSATRIAEGE